MVSARAGAVRLARTLIRVAIAAALLSAPRAAAAQVAFDSPAGRVEILGLRRWTVAMLRDSLRRYAPGQALHDAACMVTLRDSLGFAEASVEELEWPTPGGRPRTYLTIKLVEPQDAARVRWDVRPRDQFSSLLPDYAPLVLPVTDSTGAVWRGRLLYWLQFADSAQRRGALDRAAPARRADGERVLAFLAAHRSTADRRRAMRVLADDGFWVNRMVATAVLSGFAAQDSTWWTLVRALRDPHDGVRTAAEMALRSMPPRALDWRPVATDLRLLLGGTNLPVMRDVFELLARTQVAPDLAGPLLHDNGDWILDHLDAETPMAAGAAHALLVRLNGGRDLGRGRAAWSAWAARL